MTRCKNITCTNELPNRVARNGRVLVFCCNACKTTYHRWAYGAGATILDAIATKDQPQIDEAVDAVWKQLEENGR